MITLLLLSLLSGVAFDALRRLRLAVRGRNERLSLDTHHLAPDDMPGQIGISVLYSGPVDIARIERLLETEYPLFEAIVVTDAEQDPERFAALAARHRMIPTIYAPTCGAPVPGVRRLERSKQRSFRRLVLIDRAADTPEEDFDAAAAIASYDWLLPLRDDRRLRKGAVERLIAAIGSYPDERPELLRSRIGAPVELFDRRAVEEAGGFTRQPAGRIPRSRRHDLWELLAERTPKRRSGFGPTKRTAGAILAGTLLGAAAFLAPWRIAAAILLTAAIAGTSAICIRATATEPE